MKKIGFVGTDGRTFLSALETTRAKSDTYPGEYQGVVVRGTPAMQPFAAKMEWPVEFLPTADNSASSYAAVLIAAFREGWLDAALVMPEALLFEGLVDLVEEAGFGGRIIGLNQKGSFIEADKIACKKLCAEAGIPVAPAWTEADAKDFAAVSTICLEYIHHFGGAVLKYPYSAGGKGARVILSTWDIEGVYSGLMSDYRKDYLSSFGKQAAWPLLIEARMSGVEISFTIFVDKNGSYRLLPAALDYPERFAGPPGENNPITGGMGSISPHPFESPELLELAEKTIAGPLIEIVRKKNILRPCVLYPGCFVSFSDGFKPSSIRVCEINVRPGEPEWQPIVRRVRNLGPLIEAMAKGNLNEVPPEIRKSQIAMCIALVAGPGGPKQQKGYPWSLTKGEPAEIDYGYLKKKNITLVPSAMDYDDEKDLFKSDGSRVAFLNSSTTVKDGQGKGEAVLKLKNTLYGALDNGKVRVVPREGTDPRGSNNRLDARTDIGDHYGLAEKLK